GKIRKPKELPAIKDEEIPYELPRTWKWCKLGEIVIVEMGQSPPGNTYNKDGIGIPLINGPVEFGLGPFSYTKIRQYTTKPSKICSKEDFLLCVRGSTTGRTNISGFDACIGRGVAALKPLYTDDFVRWCIVNLRSKIFNTGKGSTFPSINRTEILNLLIPLPPEREQEIIIKRIKETFSKCDELKEKLIQSQKTDKRLLEALVNDALKDDKSENDEPAHIIPLPNITTTDVHGGIIAKVIQAHEKNPQYQNLLGHVKAEKVSHLVESHLGIELDRNPKRLAAGPADFPHLKKVEHRAQMKRWFTRKNQKIGYSYKPGDQMAEIIKTIDEKLGSKKDQVDELIKRFLPLDKLRSEVVATLYAAWNDLIADEKTPTDDEIVQEASTKEHWSKEKEKIPKENFYKALEWMRDKKLVPDGRGKRTVKKK
ncbi:MAG TPA: restriction endonuclease subunit S, partial [Bacteroidales bacterium]|nr:restriction endonuclease subunit S [Bacteroidales bacterium]